MMKLRKKLKSFHQKYGLFLVIILLIVAPIFINIGLMATDYYYQKTGNSLTAVGLNNENWLEFWKDYISIAIAFLGIYLVWDSSSEDRKKQYNRDSAEQYLRSVSQEENVLVDVSKCFNTGIIMKSLVIFENMAVQESRLVLQDARDKIDEAHVKFELLTELSDDFQKCLNCKYNPCLDKRIMKDIRDIFYDMEKHYLIMLNLGEEYCEKIAIGQRNLEIIDIQEKLVYNLKRQILQLQDHSNTAEEICNLKQQLVEEEKRLKELNKAKLSGDMLKEMVEPIHKEIDYISKNMRPKFNRYCKSYIDIKKKHAMELRMNGTIDYVTIDKGHYQNI